jgi:DNA-binding NarL/FixJ family response regulator
MAAEGLSSAEIARRLSISPRTAELHRVRMMNKLGLKNQTDLIRYAFKRGILTLDN